ncbi:MAG: hypothetical protein EA398_09435 [Deltaproteobacteria bacterium]|nr:MAG: hypothetical protein EA398_09435 [Deltaproteobacteria bacterium]
MPEVTPRDEHAWRFVMGAAVVFPLLMVVDVALAGPPFERAREAAFFLLATPLLVLFGLRPLLQRERRSTGLSDAVVTSRRAAIRHRRYGRVITGTLAGVFVLFIGAKALDVLRHEGLGLRGEGGIALVLLAAVLVLGLSTLRLRRIERRGP